MLALRSVTNRRESERRQDDRLAIAWSLTELDRSSTVLVWSSTVLVWSSNVHVGDSERAGDSETASRAFSRRLFLDAGLRSEQMAARYSADYRTQLQADPVKCRATNKTKTINLNIE